MRVARSLGSTIGGLTIAGTLAVAATGCGSGDPASDDSSPVRFATYNASLNRSDAGRLIEDLTTGDNKQARTIAEVVQINRPDVLLVNEFDFDAGNRAADLFRENYLQVGQNGHDPIEYPYAFTAPVNTGEPSGRDLDGDGATDGPGDAHGFGNFPGQYGMLILSKHPIDTDGVRTFQNFLWKDMPDSMLPRDYYGDNADSLRLSSKSHWDVPVDIDGERVHVLASHPTPPSFDGPEDRNGKRNHDEVRMSADYIAGGSRAEYLYDDKGARGGLEDGARFVMSVTRTAIPRTAGPSRTPSPRSSSCPACRIGSRVPSGPRKQRRHRAARTTRHPPLSTLPTSPNRTPATSVSTTCCRPTIWRLSTPESSGPQKVKKRPI